MKTIRVIGDVHGDIGALRECVPGDLLERKILPFQIGDLGYGFDMATDLALDQFIERTGMQFIRGNHDSPERCLKSVGYVGSGPFDGEIFCVGGAYSVDQGMRTEGVNWWRDEEHSIAEFNQLIKEYEECKPSLVLSHDVPQSIVGEVSPRLAYDEPSRTRQALEAMLLAYRPKLWIFGHHHKNFAAQYRGTTFICVAIGCYVDVDYPNCGTT